ncbi:MAG: pilus assembly protein [Perlucidibaca sp.]
MTSMLPSVVIITQQREQFDWLQSSLDGTAEVVMSQQNDLNDVLQLVNMASASIVFVPVRRDSWIEDVRFIEGLVAARPTLACVAVSDALDQDRVLGAMRAGAKDFVTFTARPSELAGLVRRLGERVPDIIEDPMRQGTLVAFASERPVLQSAFHALHLAAALQKQHPDGRVLLVDIGLPFAEAQQLFGLEGQFSFMDTLRNLRRLDRTLADTAFPRHKTGVSVLSAAPEGFDLGEVTTSEMFLLVGTLRSLFSHVVFNICGLPAVDMTELVIGNADHVIFVVDQSITSCRAALDFQARLKQLGVPIQNPVVLVDHYQPKISPDSKAIARSFAIEQSVELPAAADLRLRAMNIGQLMFELAPQDGLSKKYRELAGLIQGAPAAAAGKARSTGVTAAGGSLLDRIKSGLKGA